MTEFDQDRLGIARQRWHVAQGARTHEDRNYSASNLFRRGEQCREFRLVKRAPAQMTDPRLKYTISDVTREQWPFGANASIGHSRSLQKGRPIAIGENAPEHRRALTGQELRRSNPLGARRPLVEFP